MIVGGVSFRPWLVLFQVLRLQPQFQPQFQQHVRCVAGEARRQHSQVRKSLVQLP
jgi:hypothetical protein